MCPISLPLGCVGLGSRLCQLLFEPRPSVGAVLSARVVVRVHSTTFEDMKKAPRLGVLGHFSSREGVSTTSTIQRANTVLTTACGGR